MTTYEPHWARPHDLIGPWSSASLRGWHLGLLFGGVAVWWAAGVSAFVPVVFAAPLALVLLLERRVVVPRGFWVWLVFLLWVLLSATQVSGAERWLAYTWRASIYAASTVLFLHVLNSPRELLPAGRVVRALAVFWVVGVVGGIVGMLAPTVDFTSPMELVVPSSLRSSAFVQALVHPSTTAPRAFAGTDLHRPKAPFIYTNQWGSAYALALPFAIASLRVWRSPLARQGMLWLIVLSVVPLVASLDRGAWLAVGVCLAYATLRLLTGRRRRAAMGVIAAVAVAGIIGLATPLGDLVLLRLDSGYGDAHRAELYTSAVEVTVASPLIGEGTPVPRTDRPDGPSVGTHGQLWTVMVSHGVPGVGAFVAFFGWALWRTGRRVDDPERDDDVRFWAHLCVLSAVVQMPYYSLVPWGLPVVMVAMAVAWRESLALPPGRSPLPRRAWTTPS